MLTRHQRRSAYPSRVPDLTEKWSRGVFVGIAAGGWAAALGLSLWTPWALLLLLAVVPFTLVGAADMLQRRHTLKRNFPVISHFRYVLESLRPELRQYFVESDSEQNPISREKRTIVYQRAKNQLDTLPFGTRRDVEALGYEWMNHSLGAVDPNEEQLRVVIGADSVARPYSASILNISAMSFGALSNNAIRALNEGARQGGFYHNTGEGGVSSYHLENGGDLVWQIGTGYFGCRTPDGRFSAEIFEVQARHDSIRMIEIKLSQGAKPGHGGILPGRKVTAEIARIRGVEVGRDVISPPVHSSFSNPIEMMDFVARLRRLSGDKPVGLKLCLGSQREFLSLCRGMLETGITPDFVTVDGGEGGTGAAPLEFSNSVGTPLSEGLPFVNNALLGAGLRDRIRIIASGKILTAFHIIKMLALGADVCNSARGMMFALGCIQALKCNTNSCPVGVATQDQKLAHGLFVGDKAERVASFHARTITALAELLGAAGLREPSQVRPSHIWRRTRTGIRTLADIHPPLPPGAFLQNQAPEPLQSCWERSRPDRF